MGDRESDPGWKYLRLDLDTLMKEQSRPYDSKVDVWVPDAGEGYVAGQIKSVKGDMATVIAKGGTEINVKKDLCQEMNPPKFTKAEDMSNLSFLNDASVLWNLRDRYSAMLIYTYSGLFCVVINPYKRLPIYTDSVANIYIGKRKNEVPPHLWAVSDEAYRNMLQDRECQSMLITGESGAGKTENTKKVIAYFACLGARQSEQSGDKKVDDGKKKVSLEDQIVQTNPVLEAFGNAKTVRNNNSSRFGKFIRIHFSKDGRVAGCDIEHYLLEKSRVIRQAPGERAYHIFYQLMSGHNAKLCEQLEFDKKPTEYWYVNQAETTIKGVDDKEEFSMTDEAFDILNFSPTEKHQCYQICSGLVHMGDMKFKEKKEQAEPDGTDEAKKTANMYGVDWEVLLKAYCKPRVKVGTEWVNKGQNAEQVNWAKGAMAKGIYDRMFDWLVRMCNKTLDARDLQRVHFVGVLDIAGFEIFDFNSFEQLWINFVNEKLQQFFNHHMFVLEQEEYKREGIDWVFIDFGLDLAACIELIEKPMGIISMLDEECIVPKATDLTYAAKLIDSHVGKHPSIEKPKPPKGKQAEAHFALKHYAGLVRYNVSAWLEKNKDPLSDTLISIFKTPTTKNDLLRLLWEDFQTQEEAAKAASEGAARKKGKSASMMTVSMKYRESLNSLMSMLHKTHPHFVRCLIPNEQKKSGLIEADLVMNQLTCNGVLEGIRICRKGFPNRTLHADFKFRYAILALAEAKNADEKAASAGILKTIVDRGDLDADNFRVGLTKVFFKAGILARMEDLRDGKLASIFKGLQACVRWGNELKNAKRRREQIAGLKVLQNNIRSWGMLRTWPWFDLLNRSRLLAASARDAERLQEMMDAAANLETKFAEEESRREAFRQSIAALTEQKKVILDQMEGAMGGYKELELKTEEMTKEKARLAEEVKDTAARLQEQEERAGDVVKARKQVENDCANLRKQFQDVEMSLKKVESEKASKEHAIRALQEEMQSSDASIAKLAKERKHLEETARKQTEDLQNEEDKVNQMNKAKAKLESGLDQLDDSLEREKRNRQDLEKEKRKLEGENKVALETIDEIGRQKTDVENQLRKKEQELHSLASRLEDEQANVAKLQRLIKELQTRIQELEEELEAERAARSKSDRNRSDLQQELDDMNQRLDDAGGSAQAQMEMNKKREAELAKSRREMEEANVQHDNQLSLLRKKHQDAVAEMSDQLDQLTKQKSKMEKDRQQQLRQLEELASQLDAESKGKGNMEKLCKQMELQVQELTSKVDDQGHQVLDFNNIKARLSNEHAELVRGVDDAEAQLQQVSRVKGMMAAQLEETLRSADEEARERGSLQAQLKNLQHEVDAMRDQVDEETEAKNEVLRQVNKCNAEIQQWRQKFESEGSLKSDEIEESKRKINSRVKDLQEQLTAANAKLVSLEKTRARAMGELDDAQTEVERVLGIAAALEKKEHSFDKTVDEWHRKHEDMNAELDASQREVRQLGTEAFKLKNLNDEIADQLEALRRENKNLGQEIKDLGDQLSEGGRSAHEMQKMVRRLEIEKEELQNGLDEAENALQAEEAKVLRAQSDVAAIRQDIEKRISEKEEEFEATRKNHSKALESMQASLETESRQRSELARMKKKLESDINELEIALDHANKANSDAQKNLRRFQEQIKEIQLQIEDEQRQKEEAREQHQNAERRLQSLQQEKDELRHHYEETERVRKQAEIDAQEARDQANELAAQNGNLLAAKRKCESELTGMHADLDDTLNELKTADDNAKKAMSDAARLAEELHQEQEHATHLERMRKGYELNIKDLQTRLDEAEQAALKGGKKTIAKLETRIREIESELEGESRRHAEAAKATGKADRRLHELQFQVDENKKSHDNLNDLVDKLQQKLKVVKRQVEEAEELATTNVQKYRQLQCALEDAEERAETAETNVSKVRAKSRSAMSVQPSASRVGLSPSRSTVFRSGSRVRGDY